MVTGGEEERKQEKKCVQEAEREKKTTPKRSPLERSGDVSAFEMTLDRAVGETADVRSLVYKRSLEIRDLDQTMTREEVVTALCIALSKPDLAKAFKNASAAYKLSSRSRRTLKVCFGSENGQGYGHVSRGCTRLSRNVAC